MKAAGNPIRMTGCVLCALLFALAPASALAQEADAEAVDTTQLEVGYDPGGVRFDYGERYALQIAGALQARFEFLRLDDRSGDNSESSSQFSVHRGRLGFSGHVFSKQVQYLLQMELARSDVFLLDAAINFVLEPDWLSIRVGIWRRPTSRQWLTSMAAQAMVDRAPTNGAFNAARDIGVTFHNGSSGAFEYVLAIVNGTTSAIRSSGTVAVDPATGEGQLTSFQRTNVPAEFKPAAVLRLGYNWIDDTGCDALKRTDPSAHRATCVPSGYVEGDIAHANWQFGVAGSAMGELDLDEDDTTEILGSVDLFVKGKGFWLTVAGFFQRIAIDSVAVDRNIDKLGLHANASYSIRTGSVVLQPVLAYAWIDEEGDGNVRQEAGGAFNVHILGHHLKFTADAVAVIDDNGNPDADETIDARIRAQVQLRF